MLDFFGLFEVDTLYVVLGLVGIICILFILVIVNMVKTSKIRKRYEKFMSGKNAESLEEMITNRFKEIDLLKASDKKNRIQIKNINEEMLTVYKKVGINKYDAFNEMGGKLSFALAMLDKSNNGYVINAMHSREGCYTYIKEIIKGESYITLGEEEKKALDQAMNHEENA